MTNNVQPHVLQTSVNAIGKASIPKADGASGEKSQDKEFANYLEPEQTAETTGKTPEIEAVETERHNDDMSEDGDPINVMRDSETSEVVSPSTVQNTVFSRDFESLEIDESPVRSLEAIGSGASAQQASGLVNQSQKPSGETPVLQNAAIQLTRIHQANGISDSSVLDQTIALSRNSFASGESNFANGQVSTAQTASSTVPVKNIVELGANLYPNNSSTDNGTLKEQQKSSTSPLTTASLDPRIAQRDPTLTSPSLQSSNLPQLPNDNRRDVSSRSVLKDTTVSAAPSISSSTTQASSHYNVSLAQAKGLNVSTKNAALGLELGGQNLGAFSDVPEYEIASRIELQTASRSPVASSSAIPELPRHVAQQVSTAIAMSGGKKTEVSLSPAELGRVSISLNSAETGLVVTILAERPETLDLLRRGAMQLATEFTEIGYGSVEFSFGQETSEQDAPEDSGRRDGPAEIAPAELSADENRPGVRLTTPTVSLDRVDIRI